VAAVVRERCDGSVPRDAVWAALERVEDPELPLTITDLGLVRRLEVVDGRVRVGLTYTSLACPCNDMIRDDVRDALASVDGVRDVAVDDVLEPWSRDDITPEGLELLRAVAVV
jgi:metal-sulfur cluster biosynthetic enzyme